VVVVKRIIELREKVCGINNGMIVDLCLQKRCKNKKEKCHGI
jgi:hypothetical protein